MKPQQLAALAKVMAAHGLTRVQVGNVVIERPPPLPKPVAEQRKKEPELSALERLRASDEYKAYSKGAPLLVGE